MTDFPPLLISRCEDGVLHLVLNRPDRHNPLSRAMLAGLKAFMEQAADDPQLRCILLRGAGNAYFAAGGDLRDLSGSAAPKIRRPWSSRPAVRSTPCATAPCR